MELVVDIAITGAGIAGLSLALALHRLGMKSMVLESSESLRAAGFAIAMWTNAWRALDALGIGTSLRQHHQPILEMVWTSTTSGLTTSRNSMRSKGTYGDHEFYFVKRKTLLEALAKELPCDTIRFFSKLVSVEDLGNLKLLHLTDGSILKAKVLTGCDGVNSVVGRWLGFKSPSFVGRSAIRGFVEFKDHHGIEPKFLQFIGHGSRFGIAPCDATCIYWFYFWIPSKQDKDIQENPIKMKQFVLHNLVNVPSWLPSIVEKTELKDIICTPLNLRPPWELLCRHISKGNVCVAGDAFHPSTPDIGQNGCCALEDAIVLGKCLANALLRVKGMSWEKEYEMIEIKLRRYAKKRRWRAIDLAMTAYIVGSIQQSNGKIMDFVRDKLLSSLMAKLMLKKADYDCGELII